METVFVVVFVDLLPEPPAVSTSVRVAVYRELGLNPAARTIFTSPDSPVPPDAGVVVDCPLQESVQELTALFPVSYSV